MRKFFLVLLIVLGTGLTTYSQNFFTSFYAGVSNYRGDLGDGKNMLANSHPAFGLGFLYELNDRMLIRMDGSWGKISGSDKMSKNAERNLSFYSNISEFSVGFEYVLFDLYDYKVSPYAMLGVGGFRFNPFTKNRNGQAVNLYERDTEGQGFYEGRKKYKLTQLSIPIGGGVQWAITDDKRIGFVIGLRKTFTDYLDDVSTTYADPVLLAQKKGSTSVTLAYRGGEVNRNATYPRVGSRRGNPANKDSYIFSGITYRTRFINRAYRRSIREDKVSAKKSKLGCPHF